MEIIDVVYGIVVVVGIGFLGQKMWQSLCKNNSCSSCTAKNCSSKIKNKGEGRNVRLD